MKKGRMENKEKHQCKEQVTQSGNQEQNNNKQEK